MSSVNYSYMSVTADQNLGDCPICLDSIANGESVVGHDHGGEKHPIHKKCVDDIARRANRHAPRCPNCRAEFDANQVLNLREKHVTWFSAAMNNMVSSLESAADFIKTHTIRLAHKVARCAVHAWVWLKQEASDIWSWMKHKVQNYRHSHESPDVKNC